MVRCKRMAGKVVLWMVALFVLLHLSVGKPVDKRGPPPIQPVEGGSKEEEDMEGILEILVPDGALIPIQQDRDRDDEDDDDDEDDEEDLMMGTGLEYDRYLRQVVEVLESDDEFRKKLETANVSDIKSGAIAMHLELVNNTIRTKLDEIKRMEVQRLQELARIKMKSMSGVGVNRMDIPAHLDLRNPHSFEMKDLEHLIQKTTKDLEEVDKKRRDEFKRYEMEKEYEYQEKLKSLPEEQRKEEEKKHEELQKKHNEHEKINHPGSRDQFEEVWDKEDHLEDQDFDPKTFFMLHDLNGDKLWDLEEVDAVLQRELNKVYDTRNSPEEDDPMEMFEEMNRMREHVFTEIDKDKDAMISMDEFLEYTGKTGDNEKFKEDEGWETVGEKPAFTDEELEEYIRQYHAEAAGKPPGAHDLQFSPEELVRQQQMMQQGMPQQGQGMPQNVQGSPQGINQGQGLPQQGQGLPQQGQGLPQQGQGLPQQGQGLPQQGQGLPQQGQGLPQQGQGLPQQGQGLPQQGQGVPQQGHGVPQQGQGVQQQGFQQPVMQQEHINLNQGQPAQGQQVQGQAQPVQGQGQPLQGQAQPVQGQGHPVQGQPVQGQQPVA